MWFECGSIQLLSSITFNMCRDLDDDHETNKMLDQYNDGDDDDDDDDDMYSDEILMYIGTPDIELFEDELSYATATSNSPILQLYPTNVDTGTNAINDSQREYTPIISLPQRLPIPQRFIQMIRESSLPSLNHQVSDTILANVIYESFPQLLSQPDIQGTLDQLLTFIISHRQGNSHSATTSFVLPLKHHQPLIQPQTPLKPKVQQPIKKKWKQSKDPNAHRMKNRPCGLKYNKDKSSKDPKNVTSTKAKKKTKKANDVR